MWTIGEIIQTVVLVLILSVVAYIMASAYIIPNQEIPGWAMNVIVGCGAALIASVFLDLGPGWLKSPGGNN
jgi:hypothetical protein